MTKPEVIKFQPADKLADISWLQELKKLRARRYIMSLDKVVTCKGYAVCLASLSTLAEELLSFPKRISNIYRNGGKKPTKLELSLAEWVDERHAEISAYVVKNVVKYLTDRRHLPR
jgi:hypothetical protein